MISTTLEMPAEDITVEATYRPAGVESVTVDVSSITLTAGEGYTVSYSVMPSGIVNPVLTWMSSDEEIAEVDDNGLITAGTPGTATISILSEDGTQLATLHVTVLDSPEALASHDIPLFFSPDNGDEIGQYWIWQNIAEYENCTLVVFSRNGREVYRASPYQNSWDGRYQNNPLTNGDYYYILSCDDGKTVKGALRILR